MSILSADHTFESFTAGKSVAYQGQRLVKVTFKFTEAMEKRGEKKRESLCVSVPELAKPTSDQVAVLMPHILSMMQGAQNGIVRELAESGKTSVNDAQIGFGAILAYLDSESEGERLTSEAVKDWFNGTLGDILTVAFADKLGISDTPTEAQQKQITQTLNIYRENFASLAGGKTKKSNEQIAFLEKALKFAPADDALAGKFAARFASMRKANAESEAAMASALDL